MAIFFLETRVRFRKLFIEPDDIYSVMKFT